jgi:CRP/FNR family cyclic AMP-dependent transcriptional regulator
MSIIRPELEELFITEPFSRLSSLERQKIRERLAVEEIPAGRYLIRHGTEGTEMYFIAKGSVKIAVFNNGKEAILAIGRTGEPVGDISLLCGGTRTADVIAMTPCRVYRCTQEDFNAHLAEFGGLAHIMLKQLASRVRSASARIRDLALYDVTCRAARTLLELSSPIEIDGVALHVVNEPPTHQELAGMIGCTRESATRALGELVARKHLLIDDERILIFSIPL